MKFFSYALRSWCGYEKQSPDIRNAKKEKENHFDYQNMFKKELGNQEKKAFFPFFGGEFFKLCV